jgi:hypothetical protein
MNRRHLAWASAFVKGQDWQFSKTMPQWPHWYIIRGEGNRVGHFDRLAKLVERHGYDDPWGTKPRRYLRIDNFKYWVLDEEVLNRAAPISSAEVRRSGEIWLHAHGMKSGPYGKPIATKPSSKASRMETRLDWGRYLVHDPEVDERKRWENSHCLVGYQSGRDAACGESLIDAPYKVPDLGRWVYFLPACGHTVHRSRTWLRQLRDQPLPK